MSARRDPIAADQARIDREVGQRIKARRVALGHSQTWLGAQVGVSFQQIQKYERGRNRVSASALVAIADALGVTPAFLLAGLGEHDNASPHVAWACTPDGVRAYEGLSPLGPRAFDAVLATARAIRAAQGERP